MKRILFVDDEPMVLQGLQRTLRSMRDKWEMEFVGSGKEALERIAAKPFDVIVSDLRMPKMNGAELLNQVMQISPRTVRLILSGTADRELTLKCVGSTHQCLSKPCNVDDLKSTITRAASVETSLQNEHIKSLAAQMDRLPTIPALYTEIARLLQDPETTVEDVGEVIGRDIGMTAKMLKVVNSSFFGLGRTISTPTEAALYLGLDTIRSLVLSTHAFSQFESARAAGFSHEALLNHSLETAAAARAIARTQGVGQRLLNEAFVAGLLHDAGKLVLAANFPDQFSMAMRAAAQEHLPATAAERESFGADHADVGGYLLGLWGLPAPIVEAIALHHRPGLAVQKTFTSLTAVHIANVLVHEQARPGPGIQANQIDEDYLAQLGLTDRLDCWRAAWQGATSVAP